MLLRKSMALIGIGSAKVDLILDKGTYHAGEKINGYFLLKGGTIDQFIKQIDCDLMIQDRKTGAAHKIDTITITCSTWIKAEGENKIPFAFQLPSKVEHSREDLIYYFKTSMIFEEGVESMDQDIIHIQ